MKLWLKITQGLAALLLSAAALSLLLFAGALLLGLAAVVLIAAGGLFLAAPDESKKTLRLFMERIDQWIAAMKGVVEGAGEVVLTVMGAARGVRPDPEEPVGTSFHPASPAAAPQHEGTTPAQDAAPAASAPRASDRPPAAKSSGR